MNGLKKAYERYQDQEKSKTKYACEQYISLSKDERQKARIWSPTT